MIASHGSAGARSTPEGSAKLIDRYDDVMLGLYRGTVPAWIPEERRALFVRESVRRRCALGQTLGAAWRCTMFLARSLRSEDFALDVFAAWPDQREDARNVTTGLYLALAELLRGSGALWDLFQYESLVVPDLLCAPAIERLDRDRERALGDVEVYRFTHDVQSLHSHLSLYAISAAPARFGRDCEVAERTTYIARAQVRGRWVLDDVTEAVARPGLPGRAAPRSGAESIE